MLTGYRRGAQVCWMQQGHHRYCSKRHRQAVAPVRLSARARARSARRGSDRAGALRVRSSASVSSCACVCVRRVSVRASARRVACACARTRTCVQSVLQVLAVSRASRDHVFPARGEGFLPEMQVAQVRSLKAHWSHPKEPAAYTQALTPAFDSSLIPHVTTDIL